MSLHPNYVVITPVRNESQFLPGTIRSMLSQTWLPSRWVIVDDGSDDDTATIAEAAAGRASWIKVVRRENRGFRLPGQGVVDTFYDGFRLVEHDDWQFVSKFDGDLSFDPDYFERCITRFMAEPELGVAGGMCCLERGNRRIPETPGDPLFHVRGPTKIYRRECWQQIKGLKSVAGWDGIDELKANMLGWKTRTLRDIQLTHHRPTGSADGVWKNQLKFGRANYIMGYHPLFMLAKVIKRFPNKPYVVGPLGLAWGFVSAWLRGVRQVDDDELISYIRRQQLNKLLQRPSIW